MAIKNIIAQGIGFTPGSIKFIPTLGFTIGVGITLIDPHTATIGPIPLSLAANAVVRLRVKRRAGADTHYTMPEGSSLTIRGEL